MELRRPVPRDAAELLDMVQALTRHHDDVPRLTLAQVKADMIGPEAWFQVLVAEEAGALQGYAALLPLARLGYGEKGLDLHHLFVRPDARGRGIGRALIARAETLARALGCGYLIIGTHPDNLAAQAFYQSLGYGEMQNSARRFTRRLD